MTFSGSRGQEAPVSIYVVRRDGSREPFVVGLPNPTSMAVDPRGRLHVSSRFDGSVHLVAGDGSVTTVATDLGVACGIAFNRDGELFVGDRSGSVLRVSEGRATVFATIPSSVAAFHLAFGPDGWLYVTAPTLSSRDAVYRVSPEGILETFCDGLGRPQGLAFDSDGHLYVVDALAGSSAAYRIRSDRPGDQGVRAVGRGVARPGLRSARRTRRVVERDGIPARCRPARTPAGSADRVADIGVISSHQQHGRRDILGHRQHGQHDISGHRQHGQHGTHFLR